MIALYPYTLIAYLLISICYAEPKSANAFTKDITVLISKYHAGEILSPHKAIYLMSHRSWDIGDSKHFEEFEKHRKKENLEYSPQEIAFSAGAKGVLITKGASSLYFAYNLEAHWQFYTKDPYFRSADHQFEFFFDHPVMFKYQPLNFRWGYVHRSNGLGLNILGTEKKENGNYCLEKGWDRVYTSIKYDKGKFSALLKLWHIFITSGFKYAPDTGKYNPDIGDFLGYGKLTLTYHFSKHHLITLSKHLLDKKSSYGLSPKSTWEINYLVPFPKISAFQIIFKGFSGYGKNMATYNAHTLGGGLGIVLCFD